MELGGSFQNLLSDFQKHKAELQISWNGGSTRGTITRICEDCIVVLSIGTEAGFVHVIPLNNITSVRVDNSDHARALTEAAEAATPTSGGLDLREDLPRSITIKPLK